MAGVSDTSFEAIATMWNEPPAVRNWITNPAYHAHGFRVVKRGHVVTFDKAV